VDSAKDQSYVLYMLGQRELAQVVLPVGELTKAEVRERAAALGLRTATKAESMDVCFVARDERRHFLDGRTPRRPGAVVDTHGVRLARHDGVAHFTVGQRRGLGVAAGERRYVVDVDAASATITIGRREDLLRQEIPVRDLTWVCGAMNAERDVDVQVRAHGRVVRGRVVAPDRVVLADPHPRVASGQVVAFYDHDALVGGGIAA
jgi:tRNA-specific 2-thiouridylase